jgi:hypothetical protein
MSAMGMVRRGEVKLESNDVIPTRKVREDCKGMSACFTFFSRWEGQRAKCKKKKKKEEAMRTFGEAALHGQQVTDGSRGQKIHAHSDLPKSEKEYFTRR